MSALNSAWNADWFRESVDPTYRLSARALRDMADVGIERVKRGDCDAINFNLYNTAERDVIVAYMAEKAPDIKFGWNTIFNGGTVHP